MLQDASCSFIGAPYLKPKIHDWRLICILQASGRGSVGSTHSAIHLENPESHLRWYFKYFLGTGNSDIFTSFISQWKYVLYINFVHKYAIKGKSTLCQINFLLINLHSGVGLAIVWIIILVLCLIRYISNCITNVEFLEL